MSKNSEFELDMDLQLLPEWARQSPAVNRYAKYEGGEGEPRRRRGDRPGFGRGPRPGERRGPGGPQGDRPPGRGAPRGSWGDRDRPRDRDRDRDRGPRHRRPQEEIPLPQVNVSLVPEEAGVGSLAHQIKLTGRAYPLFDIAALILKRNERFHVQLETRNGEDGKPLQPLFSCPLDESVWLTEDEVATHVLARHFDTLYQTEKVPTDPPKGTYTLVAQCPTSGVILGPPNLHEYNVKLRKLHADRFSHVPFEVYKSRIRMVTDEAVVKQWIEEQSFRNLYTCLNVPEPIQLHSREEVEQHFRENHLPNLARSVPQVTFPATGQWPPMSRTLRLLIQRTLDDQRRFPLKVATVLSQQFSRHGLQFFKVNKTVTHVCVARPHYLDLETTAVSDGVRRIVEFIRAHDGCTRRQLLETLAPTPEPTDTPPAAEPPAAEAPAAGAAEAAPAQAGTPEEAEGQAATETPATEAPPAGAVSAPIRADEPTPEQAAIIIDLHWLIHQGHVIEFTNGRMELAKAPRPRPEPIRRSQPKPAAPVTAETPATGESASSDTLPPAEPAAASDPSAASDPTAASPAEAAGPGAAPPEDSSDATPVPAPAPEASAGSEAIPADVVAPVPPPPAGLDAPTEPVAPADTGTESGEANDEPRNPSPTAAP